MIVKTPGTVGGRARIDGTRMPVWALVRMFQGGWTNAQVIDAYPHLTEAQLIAAKIYWEANLEEIKQDIDEVNDQFGDV